MTEDSGRARRKELELLQGRLKEAQQDLELAQSEGFPEELQQLKDDAKAIDIEAVKRERDVRDTSQRLSAFRHDVEEAERQLLAPKAVSSVGPAVAAVSMASVVGACWVLATFLTSEPSFTGYVVMGTMAVLPAPVLAWVWRRRLSGGGTFRSPS